MSQSITPCKECGCICRYCNDHGGLHLHVEIENLKQRLLERENHIVKMETNFLKEAEKFPNGEIAAISEELLTWQDKYSRLYEAHKRVQKVNQNLEDKLLRIVDKCETEKTALTSEVSHLTRRLVDEKFNVSRLQEENERYRNDVNLAIQLLQCKPSNFVSQKYDSLPSDLQLKVRTYLSNKGRRMSDNNGNNNHQVKTIKVPIPTYPPTAMVYSINKTTIESGDEKVSSSPSNNVDIVSAAIMAKVLEEREKERSQKKHCQSCTCPSPHTTCNKSTQTPANNRQEANNKASSVETTVVSISSALSVKSNKKVQEEKSKEQQQPQQQQPWEEAVESKDGSGAAVTEAILVDISDDSPVNSMASECSTLSEEPDLISFDKSQVRGPRHCSVRLQIGTNNILLDNVVHPYTPVLYKGKTEEPPVHSALRSRSASSNSSSDEPTHKTLFRTETEI